MARGHRYLQGRGVFARRLTIVMVWDPVVCVSRMPAIGPQRCANGARVFASAAVIAPDAHTLTVPSPL